MAVPAGPPIHAVYGRPTLPYCSQFPCRRETCHPGRISSFMVSLRMADQPPTKGSRELRARA